MPAPLLIDRDQTHVVARRIERAEDRARRGDRHLVLDRAPSKQESHAKLRHYPSCPDAIIARNVWELSVDRPPTRFYSADVSAISLDLQRKNHLLHEGLRAAGRVLVAYSGGVDSSFLAYAAHRALGDAALAVTALSASYPASHREMAQRVASEFGIPHRTVDTAEMANPDYRANRSDRCYHC